MEKITLYQFESCPFCELVRQKLAEKKIEYEKVNVERDREDPVRKEIAETSGVSTIPVIKIGDKFIGDSQNIIEYLDKNF